MVSRIVYMIIPIINIIHYSGGENITISNKIVPIAIFIGLIFAVPTVISGTVNAAQAPKADFLVVHTHGQAPFPAQFQDKSKNNPTSYTWDFGDGTKSNSNSKNFIHIYKKPKIAYTVTLTVKNSAGRNTMKREHYIFVTKYAAPHANFKASPTQVKASQKVHFTDTSTPGPNGVNKPTSWKWKFGDGKTSTAKNPTHTYTKPGKYTVTLTVKNPAPGSDIMEKYNYITVK